MPIFEYVCDACGNEFEKIVFRSDDAIACPQCEASNVTRQVSAFAFKSGSGRFVSSSAKSSCGSCSSNGGCSGCCH